MATKKKVATKKAAKIRRLFSEFSRELTNMNLNQSQLYDVRRRAQALAASCEVKIEEMRQKEYTESLKIFHEGGSNEGRSKDDNNQNTVRATGKD